MKRIYYRYAIPILYIIPIDILCIIVFVKESFILREPQEPSTLFYSFLQFYVKFIMETLNNSATATE